MILLDFSSGKNDMFSVFIIIYGGTVGLSLKLDSYSVRKCVAFEFVTTAIFVKLKLAECSLCFGSWGIWRSWCERYDASCQICKRKQYSLPGDLPGNANFCN